MLTPTSWYKQPSPFMQGCESAYTIRENERYQAAILHVAGNGDGAAVGFGYVQPAIATCIPCPPISGVNDPPSAVGTGSVGSGPVGVYCAIASGSPTSVNVGGGHGYDSVVVGARTAPCPLTIHGSYTPSNGTGVYPNFSHVPIAVRGSLGIQPFSHPREYDQPGVTMRPSCWMLGPIFHVQKK